MKRGVKRRARKVRRLIVAEGFTLDGEKAAQDLKFDLESAWMDQPLVSSDPQPAIGTGYVRRVRLVLEVLPGGRPPEKP